MCLIVLFAFNTCRLNSGEETGSRWSAKMLQKWIKYVLGITVHKPWGVNKTPVGTQYRECVSDEQVYQAHAGKEVGVLVI